MRAVIAGPDEGDLTAALAAAGAETTPVEGVATREAIVAAGIDDADLFVLTSMDDATAISVVKDIVPGIRVVTYATDSLPEYARAQADLALDPALYAPEVVAEELVGAA